MTPKQIDEMIAVLQAAKEGAKPEPLELVVNLYGDNCGYAYPTRAKADQYAGPSRVRCVHMREVL